MLSNGVKGDGVEVGVSLGSGVSVGEGTTLGVAVAWGVGLAVRVGRLVGVAGAARVSVAAATGVAVGVSVGPDAAGTLVAAPVTRGERGSVERQPANNTKWKMSTVKRSVVNNELGLFC